MGLNDDCTASDFTHWLTLEVTFSQFILRETWPKFHTDASSSFDDISLKIANANLMEALEENY